MKTLLIASALFALGFQSLQAQPKGQTQQKAPQPEQIEPKTKLQAFASESGRVFIRNFQDIGRINASPAIIVQARELIDAASGAKVQGIIIEVAKESQYGISQRACVDADEIAGLLAGIDYLSKFDPKALKLPDWEAIYSTKGSLEITVFSTDSGQTRVAVSAGEYSTSTSYSSVATLAQLRALIVKAQKVLESGSGTAAPRK